MKYTLGFIFDTSLEHVLLIHKNRPEWQKGKWNGIGGKIEADETPKTGIQREVLEETGLEISDWQESGKLKGKGWTVFIFTTIYSGQLSNAKQKTDEEIAWISIANLPKNVIANLTWLISFCLDKLKNKHVGMITASY